MTDDRQGQDRAGEHVLDQYSADLLVLHISRGCTCSDRALAVLRDRLEAGEREHADLAAENERLTAALGAAHRALEAQRDADWHFDAHSCRSAVCEEGALLTLQAVRLRTDATIARREALAGPGQG